MCRTIYQNTHTRKHQSRHYTERDTHQLQKSNIFSVIDYPVVLVRGMMATLFLAAFSLRHHLPSRCSCPTPTTNMSPRWEKARELA